MLTILHGDALTKLRELPGESVQCCVTSPPFWGLRDYGTAKWEGGEENCDHVRKMNRNDGHRHASDGFLGNQSGNGTMGARQFESDCGKCGARRIDAQLGLEKTPEEYVAKMVEVFREVRRVLREDGTLWLNLGDSYCSIGHKKSNCGYGSTGLAGGIPQTHTRLREENNAASIGCKHKDLVGIPWMVAFALRADGWWLRSDIIWAKPNPMPESVTDRPTKSHEYIFLLTKSARYFYDAPAIAERAEYYDPRMYNGFTPERRERDQIGSPSRGGGTLNVRRARNDRFGGNKHNGATTKHSDGSVFTRCDFRNKRSVWTVTTKPYPEAHFATYPHDLIKPCILAGTKPGDVVLDPFAGSGTTGQVATELGRRAILIELNPKYLPLIEQRTNTTPGLALA